MDAVTDDAAARLARRYPPSRPTHWWIPAALVLAAVGAVWLVWAGAYGATGTVTARVDAFQVRSADGQRNGIGGHFVQQFAGDGAALGIDIPNNDAGGVAGKRL